MSEFFKWEYVISFFPKILGALPVTLAIVAVATAIGMALGLVLALVRIEKVPVLSQISQVFVSFVRGTPILVQLFLVYYGLPIIFTALANIENIDFVYITYGLNTAAFFSEIFRSAISSVPADQKEAAASIGLSKGQTYRRIILPQAVRIAIPATGTMIVALLQDTSLAFSLGVIDVIGKVKTLAALTYRSLEGYFIAAIIFIVLSIVLERVFAWLSKRFQFQSKAQAKQKPLVEAAALQVEDDQYFRGYTLKEGKGETY
ncbi:amino acid ABC transporter permease [Aerococcus agrisoli]|uniref:Amino acid ABC transporter permease n=1 Tax=Aerococcus agrisoli TaxID=2487350 RepID=A0A3N4GDN0_9LACT|nr:amino acid ABC transporter permease [Aerococcus agrisoli]RPA60899.1 amino acid ABC transporter permease [Aerococcus agrisoli]